MRKLALLAAAVSLSVSAWSLERSAPVTGGLRAAPVSAPILQTPASFDIPALPAPAATQDSAYSLIPDAIFPAANVLPNGGRDSELPLAAAVEAQAAAAAKSQSATLRSVAQTAMVSAAAQERGDASALESASEALFDHSTSRGDGSLAVRASAVFPALRRFSARAVATATTIAAVPALAAAQTYVSPVEASTQHPLKTIAILAIIGALSLVVIVRRSRRESALKAPTAKSEQAKVQTLEEQLQDAYREKYSKLSGFVGMAFTQDDGTKEIKLSFDSPEALEAAKNVLAEDTLLEGLEAYGGVKLEVEPGRLAKRQEADERARIQRILTNLKADATGNQSESIKALKDDLQKAYRAKYASLPGLVDMTFTKNVYHSDGYSGWTEKAKSIMLSFDSAEALEAAKKTLAEGSTLEGLEDYGPVQMQVPEEILARQKAAAERARLERILDELRRAQGGGHGVVMTN